MPEIYFHLDDQDVINILTKGEVKVPEPKKFESVICPICNAENNEQNILCWKCKNLLDESKRTEVGIEIFTQPDEIRELKNKLNNMEKIVLMLEGLYTHQIIKDKYPDIKIDKDTNITNLIIKEFNKEFEKR